MHNSLCIKYTYPLTGYFG